MSTQHYFLQINEKFAALVIYGRRAVENGRASVSECLSTSTWAGWAQLAGAVEGVWPV